MAVEGFTIPSGPYALAAVCHTPAGEGPFATVVACHGLLSSMAGRKYVQLAEIAAAAGLAFVRFDFRAMGGSTGGPEAMTLSGRLEDARAVLDFLKRYPPVDTSRVGFMGSSLGGVVAWATALTESAVGATAVWATPCDLHQLLARRGQPGPEGLAPLPEAFFDDLEGHPLLELPAGLSRVLIVHGQTDELVPVAHAHRLFAQAEEPKRLIILPDADHRLTDPNHRQRAAGETINWFASLLEASG
ncbi:MAG: alpha/beta hydrolase [Nitrospinota bacterium]